MAKPSKKPRPKEIETEPGAEERFERTVRHMLNTPPRQHQEDVRKGKRRITSKSKKTK